MQKTKIKYRSCSRPRQLKVIEANLIFCLSHRFVLVAGNFFQVAKPFQRVPADVPHSSRRQRTFDPRVLSMCSRVAISGLIHRRLPPSDEAGGDGYFID
jgi:hypothetical protein